MKKPLIWKIKRKAEIRLRESFHPWIFSNELATKPQKVLPGTLVRVHDSKDRFLAWGMAHPQALISVRLMSWKEEEIPDEPWIDKVLTQAFLKRKHLGFDTFSTRQLFGEADQLPGLILDQFVTENQTSVWVLDLQTAAAETLLPMVLSWLQKHKGEPFSCLIRRSASVRALEGLPLVSEPEVIGKSPDTLTRIRLKPLLRDSKLLHLETSLLEGQKTGFFLDQAAPIARSLDWLLRAVSAKRKVSILDVCCYVGQWGAQWTHALRQKGIEVKVTGVDASASALGFAKKNVEAEGASFTGLKADVMDRAFWESLPPFDVVLLDPPALIKSRKDLMLGTKAYLKLGRLAASKALSAFVFSSCSRLMDAARFEGLIQKIGLEQDILWLGQETQSPDHPIRPGFPESHYLKSWMGLVQKGRTHET